MKITFNQFNAFQNENLKVKVINQKSIFKNEVFPVIAIGIGWVDCDVLHYEGTHSFNLEEIELIDY